MEDYWLFYRQNNSASWINCFQDLIHQNYLNTRDPLETKSLWFCFAELLQNDLHTACDQLVKNVVGEEYHSQYIRETDHTRKPAHGRVVFQLYHCLLQVAR